MNLVTDQETNPASYRNRHRIDAFIVTESGMEAYVLEASIGIGYVLYADKLSQAERYVRSLKHACDYPSEWDVATIMAEVGSEGIFVCLGRLGPDLYGFAAVHPASSTTLYWPMAKF